MPTIVCFGDLWVNEVCVYFLWRLDLKKNKTSVQLYRFGIRVNIEKNMYVVAHVDVVMLWQ